MLKKNYETVQYEFVYKGEQRFGPTHSLYDFCLVKIVTCDFDLRGHLSVERLYPPRSVWLSKNKASFGLENK